MSLHVFDPDGPDARPARTVRAYPPVTTNRVSLSGLRPFVVRLRFPTPAARASGFEVLATEARVGVPSGAVRLGRVAEAGARDLVILVGEAPDPDAALGAVTEALRDSLVTFRVVAVIVLLDGATERTV